MSERTIREPRQLAFDELFRDEQPGHSLEIDRSFPEEFAGELARQEAFNKHLFRPNTYLHKWWARRCGSTFRMILKQFVPNPQRRDYYAPGGLEGKVVLDPMMGGGTTLHEAIRLGANVIGADIDPIPIVQARASLTQVELSHLQTAFNRFFDQLYEAVGEYFQTECPHCGATVDSRYTLCGLRKQCDCGEIVQIDQYILRQERARTIRLSPETWQITEDEGSAQGRIRPQRLITKSDSTCGLCGQQYRERLDLPYFARYVPLVVVGVCPTHGLFFRSPGNLDLQRIRRADSVRDSLFADSLDSFRITAGPKSNDLLRRNIFSYLDLFSSRQLLWLDSSIRLTEAWDGATKLNLALLVSTALEFNSLLCGYKGWARQRPGAIRHVFSHHAYSFPYTALENNPVNRDRSSGNLQQLFRDRIVRGRKWAMMPIERQIGSDGKSRLIKIAGEYDGGTEVNDQHALTQGSQNFWLIQGDSRDLPLEEHSVDFVVTDPPYYDSVQYSDLAAFFRVWLAHLLPLEVEWDYDESRSAVAPRAANGETSFMKVISGIFKECRRVLKPATGRLVFTFHHWDPNAWAELTLALRIAGFKLVQAYVVFSENPISVHIRNLKAIKHDTILVLAQDGSVNDTFWPAMTTIDTSESKAFCQQCGAALGWLLQSTYSPSEIRKTWRQLIQGED